VEFGRSGRRHASHRCGGGACPLEASFSGKPVVELVIWGEGALLGEEVGGYGNALSPLLCAGLCGLGGGRSLGGRPVALSPAHGRGGCSLRCRAGGCPAGRCFPVRGPFGLRAGCSLDLVGFHRDRYPRRAAGRNFLALSADRQIRRAVSPPRFASSSRQSWPFPQVSMPRHRFEEGQATLPPRGAKCEPLQAP